MVGGSTGQVVLGGIQTPRNFTLIAPGHDEQQRIALAVQFGLQFVQRQLGGAVLRLQRTVGVLHGRPGPAQDCHRRTSAHHGENEPKEP